MEGSSEQEAKLPAPGPEQAGQPPQKTSLKDRIRNAPLPLKVGAAATAAVLAVLGAARGAQEIPQGDDSDSNQTTATETIKPTPAQTQVTEITSTPPAKTTAPTPEATASPAPTAALSPEAPTPTEAPWAHNYLSPEILPPVPGYSPQISLEQAESILNKVFNMYPVLKHPTLGPLKVQIATGPVVVGSHNEKLSNFYDSETHTLTVNLVTTDFEGEIFHELVHSWDDTTKDNPQIAPLREALLSDPQLGRDYPDLNKLTTGDFNNAYIKYKMGDVLNLEELHLVASLDAKGFWIYDDNLDPFKEFLADNVFQNNQSQTDYAAVADFLNSQTVRELVSRNKYWAYAISAMKANVGAFETYFERLDSNLPLHRKEQEYLNALKLAGRIILLKDVVENNPQLPQIFTQNELYLAKLATDARQGRSDAEQGAATVSKYLELKNSGRLTGQDQALEAYFNAICGLAISQLAISQ